MDKEHMKGAMDKKSAMDKTKGTIKHLSDEPREEKKLPLKGNFDKAKREALGEANDQAERAREERERSQI